MEKGSQSLKSIKFYIHTFGCQMNKNDSERLAGILKAEGAQASDSLDESDLIIINMHRGAAERKDADGRDKGKTQTDRHARAVQRVRPVY